MRMIPILLAVMTSHPAVHAASVTGKIELAGQSVGEKGVRYGDFVIFSDRCAGVPKSAPPLVIRQKDCGYDPRHAAVAVGQAIEIRNQDAIIHNAFSVAPVKFDVGQQKPAASNLVTLSQPGIVKVLCRIHPEMEATILVLKNPCFARPAEDGSYLIEGLPDGDIELRVWGPRLAEIVSAKAKVKGRKPGPVPVIAIPGDKLKPESRRSRGCPSEVQYGG